MNFVPSKELDIFKSSTTLILMVFLLVTGYAIWTNAGLIPLVICAVIDLIVIALWLFAHSMFS